MSMFYYRRIKHIKYIYYYSDQGTIREQRNEWIFFSDTKSHNIIRSTTVLHHEILSTAYKTTKREQKMRHIPTIMKYNHLHHKIISTAIQNHKKRLSLNKSQAIKQY